MSVLFRFAASALISLGLVGAAAGCSGDSSTDPDGPGTQSVPAELTDDNDDMSDAVPVPFFDEKTGKSYVLMLKPSQADCLLKQDVQGITDLDAALAACGIDRRSVQD